MTGTGLPNLRRSASQFFIGGIGLALLTFICFQAGLDLSTVGFAYLIVLALVSLMGSFVASGLLTIAAAGLLNFYFAPPIFSFHAASEHDFLAIAAFLTTSMIIAGLTTKRRQADKVLSEQASLLDLTHDTVFTRDMIDVITYWNRGAEELYGWTRKEALGKVTHQLMQTIFPAPLAEINAELLRTGRWEGELVQTKRDGTRVVVASRWALQRDQQGRSVAILETNNDISETREATQKLQRQANLLEQAHDAIFVWEFPRTIVYWNRGAEQLYGYSRDQAIGRVAHELLHTEHPMATSDFEAVLQREGEWTGELTHTTRDGRKIVVESRHVLIIETDGRRLVLETNRDITERKRAQTERERLEQRLRQAEKMEAVGRLASGIAHDFNNVLGGIFAYGEMLYEETSDDSPLKRYAQNVLTAATRGRELVEQILGYSRSQRGKRAPVDVVHVVSETLELVRGSLPANIRLEASVPETPLVIMKDATRLHRVVMNLCSNAIQAMSTGGTLRVTVDTARIDAERDLSHGELAPGRYVRLSVEDSGSGMDEATLSHMFEPFFTTKEMGHGTGLGLALVYAIVTDSGGAIDVRSVSHQGTTFTIYLKQSEIALAATDDATAAAPRGGGQRVLLIDDEAPMLAVTAEVLSRLGYEPVSFSDGHKALAAFEAAPARFDVVITDEVMPGLTGTGLASVVRRHRPDLPIVLMSGHGGPLLTQQALGAGVSELLIKPLQSREIATTLARLLHPTTR